MRLLLDTHALLWWVTEPARLSKEAQDAIASPRNLVFFSPASPWELIIKARKAGRTLPVGFDQALAGRGIEELPITAHHALRTAELPPIHGDPFDRILIAQAKVECLTLVTRDKEIPKYGVPVLRA